jgi:photosystem II stability/assembly factor-like uncharacterized protein
MMQASNPSKPFNRPGLPAIVYRIGDFHSVRSRLLSHLIQLGKDRPLSLRKLTTRNSDDPAIALLDACAVMVDVLTFYQERIANEGYLRTATERQSVLELARMLGYELNSGVAASTMLAFTVEETPDGNPIAVVPKGTQIVSVPEQDELPQTFETEAEFTARADWNALRPRSDRLQILNQKTEKLYLAGTNTKLQVGDFLLLRDRAQLDPIDYLLTVATVNPNPVEDLTVITWKQIVPHLISRRLQNPEVFAFRASAKLFGFNAPRWDAIADAIRIKNGSRIRGGIYQFSLTDQLDWEMRNEGLNSYDIRCLAYHAQSGFIFAGTPMGIFRSKDNAATWSLVNAGLTNFNVYTLLAHQDGRLFAGTASGGVFQSIDQGDNWSVISNGTISVVEKSDPKRFETKNTGIPSNTVVRAIAVQAAHIFVQTDAGIYVSINLGQDWELKAVGDNTQKIVAIVTTQTDTWLITEMMLYQYEVNKKSWDAKITWGVPYLTGLAVDNQQKLIFSQKPGFVYRYDPATGGWTYLGTLGQNLRKFFIHPGNNSIVAATNQGIFRLNASNNTWELINTARTIQDAIALLTYSAANREWILTGSLFTGFIGTEWEHFNLDPLPRLVLDTEYPKILADSLVVIKDGDSFEVQQVAANQAQQQQAFLLDAKVTQLSTRSPLKQPTKFNRRTSLVLVQSESLALTRDRLTIPIQQHHLWADPIAQNQIYLSQYVTGLTAEQRVIVSGQRMRGTLHDIGGVMVWSQEWKLLSQALAHTSVTTCVTESKQLFVGTAGGGVFRSLDGGQHWDAINLGLGSLEIQALTIQIPYLFAGTPIGIFRRGLSVQDDSPWQAMNRNLTHGDVRSLLADRTRIWAGTVQGGVLFSIDAGASWNQTNLNNANVQVLVQIAPDPILSRVFNLEATPALRRPRSDKPTLLLAGTAENGAFYSNNGGVTWQAIAVEAPIIKSITGFSTVTRSRQDSLLIMSTAGSGIFRLIQTERDQEQILEWESVQNNPTDLVVHCLFRNGSELLAGTEKRGIFRSIDDGNVWAARNAGLTIENAGINPNEQVNFDVRSLIQFGDQVLAAGMGTLISLDGLYSRPIKAGDQIQIMAPPEPVIDFAISPPAPQKWLLQNSDGFIGSFISTKPELLELLPAERKDPIVSEMATIAIPPLDEQLPILTLIEPLRNAYDPATTSISANVVSASHGETVVEVLGSGDGTQKHQRFILKQPPLTYTAAATATGHQSSLQLRVNDLLWQEVPFLYDRKPQEPIYITRIADDASVNVIFGDGESGLRLPSGQENITATYRTGIGRAGQMKARQLSQLKTRPLGISDVINPLPATGAADPETLLEARESAPRTVRTLDRIVSLQDYEDFARAFTGIGKAQAVVLWAGELQQVQITVAGLEGDAILSDSRLYESLVQAIDAARDPIQQVQIDSYELLRFNLKARLLIDSRYRSNQVVTAVETALLNRFNFEQRHFAQAVTASEAIATMQAIPGVIAVDLDALHRLDRPLSLEQVLPALPARWQISIQDILPAQLLLINPAGIDLRTEVTL